MKTHEVAKALTHLARVLRAGPNIELEEMVNFATYVYTPKQSRPTPARKTEADLHQKGEGLALLSQMANYSKRDLLELADALGIPIEVRKADAVRDVLGKILKKINDDAEIRDRLSSGAEQNVPKETSALAKALTILMSRP